MAILGIAALVFFILSFWLAATAFGAGLLKMLQQLLAATILACAGLLLSGFLLLVHFFQAFAGETLVATITTRRLSSASFELSYAPSGTGEDARTQKIQLEGDQWWISGGIVKWHPWLTALGLSSYHKPMRLGGQFSHPGTHGQTLQSDFLDLSPGTDWFWEMLYRLDPYLPCIEAVYGSSAYVYVEPRWTQEVYVTPSGYLIKRARIFQEPPASQIKKN